jgi:hypothetical protein
LLTVPVSNPIRYKTRNLHSNFLTLQLSIFKVQNISFFFESKIRMYSSPLFVCLFACLFVWERCLFLSDERD